MRSINVKRVAAVAAGTAMVLSSLASGLAVTVGSDVPAMLKTWKSNLDKVQIVVGTDGSYVSDAISAARIAAELANIAYTSTAVTVTQDDPTVTTTGDKSVTATGGGVTVTVSPVEFPIVYSANTSATSAYQATPSSVNKTLTPTTVPGILSTKKIQTYVSNQLREITYEEQIEVDNSQVTYQEQQSPQGHGLHLAATQGNLVYRLAFLGSGLQQNSTYSETPTITMLGQDYAIDTTDLASGLFTIYSGTKKTLESGSSYTTDDGYKIDVVAVGQVTSSAGTQLAATVSVTSPTGAVETATINSNSGRDFFVSKVSVFIESAIIGTGGKNLAVARIGTGKKQFTVGLAFPLDDRWTVKSITISGTSPNGYITQVNMQYGKATAATALERGLFDGTVTNGLKQGDIVPGPKNAAGTSLFDISLKGFGGTTTVDTSHVTVKGVGTTESNTEVLQVTYTDSDGLVNVFDPTSKAYAAINTNSTAGATVTLTTGTQPYTFVGNSVLYFNQVRTSGSGTSLSYTPYFKIGGVAGTEVGGTPVAANASGVNSTLTYQTSTQAISCQVLVNSSAVNTITMYQATGCNLVPLGIQLGPNTVMDTAMPTLDLRYVTDGTIATVANYSTGNSTFPFIKVNETAGPDFSIVFDSSTVAGIGSATGNQYTGLVAYPTTIGGAGVLNVSGSSATVDQVSNAASSSNFEVNAYQITPVGSVLDGSVAGTLSFDTPEAARSSYVAVAQKIQAANVTTGDQVVKEGGIVGGVTIKSISCPTATATKGAATASPASAATVTKIVPKTLVVTDAAGDATSAYQIVVGGPYVNKVARAMSAATLNQVTTGAGASVVLAEGTKVLVAGYTATDTAAAADELIKQLELLRE